MARFGGIYVPLLFIFLTCASLSLVQTQEPGTAKGKRHKNRNGPAFLAKQSSAELAKDEQLSSAQPHAHPTSSSSYRQNSENFHSTPSPPSDTDSSQKQNQHQNQQQQQQPPQPPPPPPPRQQQSPPQSQRDQEDEAEVIYLPPGFQTPEEDDSDALIVHASDLSTDALRG